MLGKAYYIVPYYQEEKYGPMEYQGKPRWAFSELNLKISLKAIKKHDHLHSIRIYEHDIKDADLHTVLPDELDYLL
jgi:hypothetical protein